MRTDTIRLAIRHAVLALTLALLPCSAWAQQVEVNLALVLAVDCSGSVDDGEYKIQMGGIAHALRDPEIIAAIERWTSHGVAVSVVQWSDVTWQFVAIDWTTISDHASAHALATRIEASSRAHALATRIEASSRAKFGGTALGDMLRFAKGYLEEAPFQSARRVIDVSGDGESSSGESPDRFRDAAVAAGITINGLAILNEIPTLGQYYASHVIGGPEAFVISAPDYDDFAHAMRQKLLQEIRGAPVV